ncbi:FUSC family protein, partial [Halovibrio sp. HP20-50]|uniref:FUSC family protein n=1 Tax=Halovibrio sp. HP20-59 TaxID=3080275 RepID=UPI00294B7B46
ATVVSTVLLPRSVGPAVATRVDGWLAGARNLSREVLAGRSADQAVRDLRLKLAADAVDLDGIADHLSFDRSVSRETVHWLRAL